MGDDGGADRAVAAVRDMTCFPYLMHAVDSGCMLHGATRVRRDPGLQEVPMQTIVEDRRLPADIDAQPVVQAAAALKPTVRRYHDEIEREQRLSPGLVEQMHAAGFYRLLLPRSLGGLQADPLTYIRVVELLAEGAGSVGWNVANNGVVSLVTLGLPDDGVQEIYPKGHRTVIAGTAVQGGGQAVPVEGGYRVSGRWTFGSGCHEAAWMLGSFQILDDGQPRRRDDGGMFWRGLFPRAEVEVIPGSWEVSGLRGTGSFDWTVSDFFLPKRRTMVHAGVPLDNQWAHWPGITYALPAPAWVGPHQCAVITGLARAGIDALVELAADKTPRDHARAARPLPARRGACRRLRPPGDGPDVPARRQYLVQDRESPGRSVA